MHTHSAFAVAAVVTISTAATKAHTQARSTSDGTFVPTASAFSFGNTAPVPPNVGPFGEYPAREQPTKPKAPRPARGSELVYLNAEGGYQNVSLTSLRAAGLRPESQTTSSDGLFYGVGAGLRFGFLTVGGRFRSGNLSSWDLTTVDGELGARVNLNRFEPYFTLGAGYAHVRASGQALASTPDVSISGLSARAGVGVDYYPDKLFSVGMNFTGDLLAMARPGFSATTSPEAQARDRLATCDALPDPRQKASCATNLLTEAEGSSFGFAGTFALVMGLHF